MLAPIIVGNTRKVASRLKVCDARGTVSSCLMTNLQAMARDCDKKKAQGCWHTQLVTEERGICICVRRLASSRPRRAREWKQAEPYFTEQCSYKDNIVSACTHSVRLMHVTVYVSVWQRVCVLYNNGRYECVCAGQVEPKSTPSAWTINSQLLPPH